MKSFMMALFFFKYKLSVNLDIKLLFNGSDTRDRNFWSKTAEVSKFEGGQINFSCKVSQ